MNNTVVKESVGYVAAWTRTAMRSKTVTRVSASTIAIHSPNLDQQPCCNEPPRGILGCNSPPESVLSAVNRPSAANGDVRRDPSIIVPGTYRTALLRMCRCSVRPEIGWITDRRGPNPTRLPGPWCRAHLLFVEATFEKENGTRRDIRSSADVCEWTPDWYGASSGGAQGGIPYAVATG